MLLHLVLCVVLCKFASITEVPIRKRPATGLFQHPIFQTQTQKLWNSAKPKFERFEIQQNPSNRKDMAGEVRELGNFFCQMRN